MNQRQLGMQKERLAGKLLELHGYRVLRYNYRCRQGEVDIVAKHGDDLVFVEVKFRSKEDKGLPQEAVNYSKQRRISNAAKHYIMEHHLPMDEPYRFDVIAIQGKQYRIIENAFECL